MNPFPLTEQYHRIRNNIFHLTEQYSLMKNQPHFLLLIIPLSPIHSPNPKIILTAYSANFSLILST